MSTYKAGQAVKAKLAADYAGRSIDDVMELAVQTSAALDGAEPGTPERITAVAVRSYLTDRVAAAHEDTPTVELLAEIASCMSEDGQQFRSEEHAAVKRGCERVLEARYPIVPAVIGAVFGIEEGSDDPVALLSEPHGSFTAWEASLYRSAARMCGEAGE